MSIRFRRAQKAEIHVKDFGRLRSERDGLDGEFDLVQTNDLLHSELLNILVVCQNLKFRSRILCELAAEKRKAA